VESFPIALPSRGGSAHALAWGPVDRPVDIVFLHANGFNALTYRAILEPLGAEFRVIALDQRGHGLTALPTATEGRGDWLDLRDDLVAVLSSLGVRDAVLSGHSMGGTVSILTAAAWPDFARALVLFDPVVMLGARPADVARSPMVEAARRRRATFASRAEAFASYRGRGAFRTWPDAILRDYLTDGLSDLADGRVTLSCSPEWEASGFAAHGHDTGAAIAAFTCPTRILKAEQNSTCRLEPGDFAPTGGLTIEVVPGTTHFLPMERPDIVRAALSAAVAAKA
jgi:pimeloyl-ACP methyl ester carboxylesterase